MIVHFSSAVQSISEQEARIFCLNPTWKCGDFTGDNREKWHPQTKSWAEEQKTFSSPPRKDPSNFRCYLMTWNLEMICWQEFPVLNHQKGWADFHERVRSFTKDDVAQGFVKGPARSAGEHNPTSLESWWNICWQKRRLMSKWSFSSVSNMIKLWLGKTMIPMKICIRTYAYICICIYIYIVKMTVNCA